jgi:serine/threonine-protein kinase
LLRAFADVCLAVEFAHQRGIIHRDLKPANIALGDFGEVYVLDWGIARVLDEADEPLAGGGTALEPGATALGTVLGTPGYMAPEQQRGEPVDARADVYALGCILFEILTGEALDTKRGDSHAGTPNGRPSTRAPGRDVPPELDRATVHATALDRGDRPATARELGAMIEGFLDGDRDVAQRKKLAAAAHEDALAAIARGDGEAERRDAIRAAGRALALDPDTAAYGELVARLMIEPPKTVPAEVEKETTAQEIATIAGGASTARRSAYGTALGLTVLYWAGIRDPALLGILIAAGVGFNIARSTVIRGGQIRRPLALAMLAAFGMMAAVSACSPLVALPLVVHIFSRWVAQPHLIHPWHAAVVTIAGTLLPVVLGMLGATRPLIDIVGSDIVLHTPATALAPLAGFMLLLVNALLLPVYSTLITFKGATERERVMRQATLLQAWQLRQLVRLRR